MRRKAHQLAFGIKKDEIREWKRSVEQDNIAFLTHYWYDPRFPHYTTVTKVGCNNVQKLIKWGNKYGLKPEWIDHHYNYPHFDLLGERQYNILCAEGKHDHIKRFNLTL